MCVCAAVGLLLDQGKRVDLSVSVFCVALRWMTMELSWRVGERIHVWERANVSVIAPPANNFPSDNADVYSVSRGGGREREREKEIK